MKHIITLILSLCSIMAAAQTVTTPPTGSKPYGTPVAAPSGEILVGRNGSYTYITRKAYTDSLIALGYTKQQVDAMLADKADLSDLDGVIRSGDNNSELNNDAGYVTAATAPVTSVNSKTGVVVIDKGDLGLGNVDNTSDANKPISTATAAALAEKEISANKRGTLANPDNIHYPTTAAVATAISEIPVNTYSSSNGILQVGNDFSPIYGTSAGTVAQGNDSRIINGQSAYDAIQPITVTDANDIALRREAYGGSPLVTNFPSTFSGVVNLSSTPDRLLQIGWFYGVDNRYYLRKYTSSTTSWQPWVQLWHSGNFTPPVAFTRLINGLVPAPGGSGSTRFLREDNTWAVPDGGGGGGTDTDLSIQNRTSTTLDIGSSTGTAATVPIATTSLGGLMSAADKIKVDAAIIGYTETDPTVPSYVKSISSGNISNWNTAFGWGDYRLFGIGSDAVSISPSANWDNIMPTQFVVSADAGNSPFSTLGQGIHIRYNSTRAAQLFLSGSSSTTGALQFRQTTGSGTWGPVREVWHDGNFTPSDYLAAANFTWTNLSGKPSTFTPSPHVHSGADITSGTISFARLPTGTSSSTVAIGNHTHTLSGDVTGNIGATTIANSAVTFAKMQNVGTNTIVGRIAAGTGDATTLTATQVRTIINVANGATANSSDATLLNRANHTGTQAISTVSGLQSALDGKSPTLSSLPSVTSLTEPRVVVTNSNFSGTEARMTSGSFRSNFEVAGIADNNAFTGSNSFSQPVTVANATTNGHAVNLGQLTWDNLTVPNGSISNSKLASQAAYTLKGRMGGDGAPQNITMTNLKDMLGLQYFSNTITTPLNLAVGNSVTQNYGVSNLDGNEVVMVSPSGTLNWINGLTIQARATLNSVSVTVINSTQSNLGAQREIEFNVLIFDPDGLF